MYPIPERAMDELMDFISELHAQDRQKQAYLDAKRRGKAEGKAEGKIEGQIEVIQSFIKNGPKEIKVTASSIATLFGVSKKMAQSVLSRIEPVPDTDS